VTRHSEKGRLWFSAATGRLHELLITQFNLTGCILDLCRPETWYDDPGRTQWSFHRIPDSVQPKRLGLPQAHSGCRSELLLTNV
jgi:hypothetical protein